MRTVGAENFRHLAIFHSRRIPVTQYWYWQNRQVCIIFGHGTVGSAALLYHLESLAGRVLKSQKGSRPSKLRKNSHN